MNAQRNPRQSKPGPRLEVLAGTRTVISCIGKQSPFGQPRARCSHGPAGRFSNECPLVDTGGRQCSNAERRRQPIHCVRSISKYAVGAQEENEFGWIDPDLLRDFQAEGTDAHRLCTFDDGWVERFGRDASHIVQDSADRQRLVEERANLDTFCRLPRSTGVRAIYSRKNEQREPPRLIVGDPSEVYRPLSPNVI